MVAIEVNANSVISGLSAWQKQKLPFALAASLTQTAKDGQGAMQTRLHKIFTLRNTWTERGMRITPALKSASRPAAQVIADRSYLLLQEIGGEKIAHQGRHYLCIPIRSALGLGVSQLIPSRLKPRNLIEKGKGFKVKLRDGRLFLFMRIMKGHGKIDRFSTIVPVYRMIPEALVQPALDMKGTILQIVNERFMFNFKTALFTEVHWLPVEFRE